MDMKLKKRTTEESYDSNIVLDWDSVPSRSTLNLFHASLRLKEAQTELIVKHIDAQKEKVYNLRGWQEVQANKRELRRQCQETNSTVCENKASAYRFIQKTKEFLRAQTLLQDEIHHTKLAVEKLSETKAMMEKYVTMYSELFTSYLETVAQKCAEFNSVQDILNWYRTMENCRNECAQLLKKEMDESLELHKEMMKLIEEKSSRLKVLDNSSVMLEVRRKTAEEVRMNWNHVVTHLEQEIAKRSEESVTLREGCYSLYKGICNKRKVKATVTKEDVKNQMHYIQKTILFYKDVLHLAMDIQQFKKQNAQTETSICKSSFVKGILNDLVKRSVENTTKRK